MTATQRFIEKAIEGGWEPKDGYVHGRHGDFHIMEMWVNSNAILLDPAAWQAVGKVEGWKSIDVGEDVCFLCGAHKDDKIECQYSSRHRYGRDEWRKKWHALLDALAEGKSVEEYLATIV